MPVIPNGGGGTGGQSAGTQIPQGGPRLVEEAQLGAEQQQGIGETASLEPGVNNEPPAADFPE